MRIDKIISSMGIASRREIAKVAKSGGVLVDGVVIKDPSRHIDPEKNIITYLGRVLRYQTFTYVMLNKPKGRVTTMKDEADRPTVAELVQIKGKRLYPVGRLDMYSEGLLIMTDDGEAANRMMHPSHRVEKTYIVDVVGEDIRAATRQMRKEMEIDGYKVKAIDSPALHIIFTYR